MRILNEGSSVSKTKNEKVLKIYSSKELMSKTFAKQFSRKMKESFLDSFYTNTPKGSFRRDNLGEELPSGTVSSYGLLQTRFYVFRYIDSVLEMGNNIATQSVENVKTDKEWFIIFNNILEACNIHTFSKYEPTKIEPFMVWWRRR